MMDEQLRPIASHAPEPIIVEIEGVGELEFPGDTDPSVIEAKVKELTAQPEKDYSQYGPMSQLYRDMDEREQNSKWAKENAPTIGAGLATTAAAATGVGLIPAAIVAGGGGYLGARSRGDDRGTATGEGLKQGGLQLAGGGLVKAGQRAARFLMRGGIPKGIQADFGGKQVAQEALDTGAIPGSERSAARVSRLSTEANQARDAAAANVPPLTPQTLVSGFRPIYNEAVEAMTPARSHEIAKYARGSAREIKGGLSGKGQLARKTVKAQEGKVAMNADNSKTTNLNSQLANTERDIIASHLRQTPGMEDALNLSQRRMGLDRFMQDSLTSNMVNRMGGGPINMLRSPMGLGITAHVVNQGSRVVDPQILRAMQIAILSGQQE
jgi:hypothetical protein